MVHSHHLQAQSDLVYSFQWAGGQYNGKEKYFCTFNNQTTFKGTTTNCTSLQSSEINNKTLLQMFCCNFTNDWKTNHSNENPPLFYCGNQSSPSSNQVITMENCQTNDTDRLSVEQNALNMDHKFVELIVWFFALAAVIGNLGVAFHCIWLNIQKKKSGTSAKVHRFLILNLALADFLMGVYLIIYAFQHMHGNEESDHEGKYNRLEFLEWMESRACLAMGVMSFTSSQVSVTLLIIITSFRLQTTLNPFNINGRKQLKKAMVLTTLAWCFWLIVALTPVVGIEFVGIRFNNFIRFDQSNFCYANQEHPEVHYEFLSRVVKLTSEALSRCGQSAPMISSTTTWKQLVKAAKQLHLISTNETIRYYGYYNERSVCTATYFPTSTSSSMPFTMAVVCFNLISFVFIIFAYVWIWRSSNYVGKQKSDLKHLTHVLSSKKQSGSLGHINKKSPKVSLKNLSLSRLSISRMSTTCSSGSRIQTVVFKCQRGRENRRMQRRILVMILTDFFCWVPLCFLAVAFTIKTATMKEHSTEYHQFLDKMYPILDTFTVIVLPINSALNPFIYSTRFWHITKRTLVTIWKKTKSSGTAHTHVTSMMSAFQSQPSDS